ncbi:MAG: DnaD domain protein [Bacilli bacterium]|nr:DnaD domain protein [Bacilli bacterium]
MISEAIDFKFLLIENYRKLKIKENELATIFVIDHLISQGNKFVTADLLALKMNLDIKDIDKILANLITKGYFEYKTRNKKTVGSLDPLKKKLYKEFQMNLNREEEEESSEQFKNDIEKANSTFEELLERSLSPVEKTRIHEWISSGYTADKVIDALKEALNNGKKSIRSVEKVLFTWAQSDDLMSDGHTSLSSEWDKNLEETIKIAKTPWIKKPND